MLLLRCKGLDINIKSLKEGLHHFDDIDIIVDGDHRKKILIKKKLKKIKEKKKVLKKKLSYDDQESL